jgi:hypothetical protein
MSSPNNCFRNDVSEVSLPKCHFQNVVAKWSFPICSCQVIFSKMSFPKSRCRRVVAELSRVCLAPRVAWRGPVPPFREPGPRRGHLFDSSQKFEYRRKINFWSPLQLAKTSSDEDNIGLRYIEEVDFLCRKKWQKQRRRRHGNGINITWNGLLVRAYRRGGKSQTKFCIFFSLGSVRVTLVGNYVNNGFFWIETLSRDKRVENTFFWSSSLFAVAESGGSFFAPLWDETCGVLLYITSLISDLRSAVVNYKFNIRPEECALVNNKLQTL